MICRRFPLPDGNVAIVCSGRTPRRRCQIPHCDGTSVAQCDYPVTKPGRKSKTCDLHLCAAHRVRISDEKDTDYCPAHDRLARDSQRATEERGAAASTDGAQNEQQPPTRGDADAALHPGGGTAAPRPAAESPRVISQLALFGEGGRS